MEYLKEVKKIVSEYVPKDALVTNIDLEGPEIAIYTKNPKAFFENDNYVSKIAFELKKRVNVRTDKALLNPEEQAKQKIMELVPEDAQITDMMFDSPFSEVTIEALKPGLVIGKGGSTSKQIILETGWIPNIIRAPTTNSDILKGIRRHLHKYSGERKKILQEVAKKIYEPRDDKDSWIRLTALGAFREIGRSALLLETRETKVMLDCGANVGDSNDPYPYFDSLRFPINELDAVIVTHAHLDHSGMIPFLFKLGYRGPVYCTLPTRDLMALLLFDYVDVMVKENKEPHFTERDVKEMLKYCIPRDYREVTDIAPDMRLTFHNAAHILGSASAHLHLGNGAHNLLYTADIKYGFTRLFNNLDLKYPRLETLIVESTYGGRDDIHPHREEAEDRLLKIVKDTIDQGGNILIPVFAVGRAQEIMLVLENFYRKGMLDANVYIDGLSREASAIHTAYPEYLRQSVQRRILQNDSPFTSEMFKDVADYDKEEILKNGKAIIMASSGMLTGGPSLDYFQRMAEDPTNTILFVGWQSEGSLGRKIQSGVKNHAISENGRTRELKINMRVETVEGFSGHCDRNQLINYLKNLKPKPKRILINHGAGLKPVEFAKYVSSKFKVNATAPRTLDSVRLR